MCEPLQAGTEASEVHEGEHVAQALVLFSEQVAGCTIEVHHAGRVAMNTHLALENATADVIAVSDGAVIFGNELWHDKQRDAFRSRRRVGQARQHDVNDVLGEIVFA